MSTLSVTNIKHGSSASNNIALDSSGNATFAGTVVPASSFLRNRIINGGMQIWQRGATFSTGYTADRWFIQFGNSPTFSRSTDVPSAAFQFSLSVSGSNFITLGQRIESVNSYDLVGQSVTVSFWLKQTAGAGAGSIGVYLYFPSTTDNYSSSTQTSATLVTGTTSWAFYTVTFSGASIPATAANGVALAIYAHTAGSATFLVTGVQLEVGSVATPFERRQYGTELALCQRYYVKAPTSTFVYAVANQYQSVQFPATMRAAPTVAITVGAGTPADIGTSTNGFYSYNTSAPQGAGYTASAEL